MPLGTLERSAPPLFKQGPSALSRLAAFSALALFLMVADTRFQITGPVRRLAAMLAGQGFIVSVPEIYHEFEPAGTVLLYDQAGADRGNALKTTKELAAYDTDARATDKLVQVITLKFKLES